MSGVWEWHAKHDAQHQISNLQAHKLRQVAMEAFWDCLWRGFERWTLCGATSLAHMMSDSEMRGFACIS